MNITSREQFFAVVPKAVIEEVPLPAPAEGVVRIRQLTVGERDKFEAAVQGKALSTVGLRARLLIACAVDEEGRNLFTNADVEALSDLPANVVEPLVEAATRLNAISSADLDELEKN